MLSHKENEPLMRQHEKGSLDLGFCEFPKTNNKHLKEKSQITDNSVYESEEDELKDKFVPKMNSKNVLVKSFIRLGLKEINQDSEKEIVEGFLDSTYMRNVLGFTARSVRCSDCGKYLIFSRGIYSTGEIDSRARLKQAYFCKDRLCPLCAWRRTLKIFGQISKIIDNMPKDYRYIFLTLTVRNCKGEDLSKTIDNMNSAFYRMKKTKRFKNSILGFVRVLEVTVNNKDGSYHPHFHCILAVNNNYFDKYCSDYINHSEWLSMWRDAVRDYSIKFVNVKVIKPKKYKGDTNIISLASAVAETAKYSVKASDYLGIYDKKGNLIKPFSNDVIDSRVKTLALSLAGRRLVAYGGCFYDIHKKLKLDDALDGDLLHLENENLNPYIAEVITTFSWCSGVGNYKKGPERINTLDSVYAG